MLVTMNFRNNKIVSDIDLGEISSMACVAGSGKIGKNLRKMARGNKVFSNPSAPQGTENRDAQSGEKKNTRKYYATKKILSIFYKKNTKKYYPKNVVLNTILF